MRFYLICLVSVVRTMCLEQLLRDYRVAKSASYCIPRYCIFGDVLLRQIVQTRPQTVQELKRIEGMGDSRCKNFGVDILTLVQRAGLIDPRKPTPPINRENDLLGK